MMEHDAGLVGYTPVPIPAWVRERANRLRQYMFDLGVRVTPASERVATGHMQGGSWNSSAR